MASGYTPPYTANSLRPGMAAPGSGAQNPAPSGVRAPAPAPQPYHSAGVTGFNLQQFQQQASSPFDSALAAYRTQYAPTIEGYNQQYNSLLRGGALESQNYGYNTQGLNLDYQSSLGDLNERIANNQVDQSAAARQPNLIDQLLASQNREFDIQREGLGTDYRKNRYNLDSQATGAGTYLSGGTNKGRKSLYEQLTQGLGTIGENQQQNTLNQNEQKAQAQDRMKALQNTAMNLNMKPEQLKAQLELGLQKAGLQHLISGNDLLDAVTKNDLQGRQLLNDIIGKAQEYSTARGVK